MNTHLDDMYLSDEFRRYRRLMVEEAVRLIDIEDREQTNEYRCGLIALLRRILRIPLQEAGPNTETLERHLFADMAQFRGQVVSGATVEPK